MRQKVLLCGNGLNLENFIKFRISVKVILEVQYDLY